MSPCRSFSAAEFFKPILHEERVGPVGPGRRRFLLDLLEHQKALPVVRNIIKARPPEEPAVNAFRQVEHLGWLREAAPIRQQTRRPQTAPVSIARKWAVEPSGKAALDPIRSCFPGGEPQNRASAGRRPPLAERKVEPTPLTNTWSAEASRRRRSFIVDSMPVQ